MTRNVYGNITVNSPNGISIVDGDQITEEGKKYLKIEELKEAIRKAFLKSSPIKQLSVF